MWREGASLLTQLLPVEYQHVLMFLRASWSAVGISHVGTRWVLGPWRGMQVKDRSGRTDCCCRELFPLPWYHQPAAFLMGEMSSLSHLQSIWLKKKFRSQATQKSFDFLGAYSKNKNVSPQRPTQIMMCPQLFCLITCINLSLDISSKIHVRYQQLQDSTPGMAPFQWWNHTGMCFSSKH